MLALDPNDTIAAIASPSGPGLLGLVRVTGPDAWSVATGGFESDRGPVEPKRAERRSGRLRVAGLGRPLAAAVGYWPGSRTYTGQPLAEVEVSGSPPLLRAVLADYLGRGARLAEPGEFTLRAFLSGRIDLTQSEAVLGVIDASTPEQLDSALRQLAGGLASPIADLRDRLADTLAHLEANLDFAEEPDVDPLGVEALARSLDEAAATVADLARRLQGRDRSGGRPRVVLVGPPNAGKSRLFNALVGGDRAIVSPVAGTTRDYLDAPCDCDGLAIDLVDTAGEEDASGSIGGQAQAARLGQAAVADLLLECRASVEDEEINLPSGGPVLLVRTKADLAVFGGTGLSSASRSGEATPHPSPPPQGGRVSEDAHPISAPKPLADTSGPSSQAPSPLVGEGWGGGAMAGGSIQDYPSTSETILTSAATGVGLETLRSRIARTIRSRDAASHAPSSTAARCGESLAGAETAIRRAAATLRLGGGDELVAIDLRQGLDDLGRVVGAVVTDDLLDRIFRRFCIGK